MLRVGLGLAGIALACVIHFPFDRNERRAVLTWISSGLRPIVAAVAALAGIVLAGRSLLPGLTRPGTSGDPHQDGALQSLLGPCSDGACHRSAAAHHRASHACDGHDVLSVGGIGLLLNARSRAGKVNRTWQLVIGVLAALSMVLIGLVVRVDASATRFRTVLPAALTIGAALLIANTICEYLMAKRTYGDATADRTGRRMLQFGGLLAFVGIAIRLLFTNFTDAQAAALRAADKPVPQNVLRETVLWWFLVAAIGAYVLAKTDGATGSSRSAETRTPPAPSACRPTG